MKMFIIEKNFWLPGKVSWLIRRRSRRETNAKVLTLGIFQKSFQNDLDKNANLVLYSRLQSWTITVGQPQKNLIIMWLYNHVILYDELFQWNGDELFWKHARWMQIEITFVVFSSEFNFVKNNTSEPKIDLVHT